MASKARSASSEKRAQLKKAFSRIADKNKRIEFEEFRKACGDGAGFHDAEARLVFGQRGKAGVAPDARLSRYWVAAIRHEFPVSIGRSYVYTYRNWTQAALALPETIR